MTSDEQAANCRRLWAAVVLAALDDARKHGDTSWFSTPDAALCASLAGLEPGLLSRVREAAEAAPRVRRSRSGCLGASPA